MCRNPVTSPTIANANSRGVAGPTFMKNRRVGHDQDRSIAKSAQVKPMSAQSWTLVGKDEASAYVEGRTRSWLKVKQPRYREGEQRWETKT